MRSTSLFIFIKSCQQIWVRVNQPFISFKPITSEVKQYYEALFLSNRPRTECSISQFRNTKCTHSIFRTIDRGTRGLLAKPLKKISKITYIPFSLLQSELWSCLMNINRVTLQHNKEFIMVVFYLMVLSTCNLQKRLFDTRGILSTPASDVH